MAILVAPFFPDVVCMLFISLACNVYLYVIVIVTVSSSFMYHNMIARRLMCMLVDGVKKSFQILTELLKEHGVIVFLKSNISAGSIVVH